MHVINIALEMSLPWTMFWTVTLKIADSVESLRRLYLIGDLRFWHGFFWVFFIAVFPLLPTPHLCGYWDESWRGEICFNTGVWSYSPTVQLNTLLSELELGECDINSPMLVTALIILIWVVILVYWESKPGGIVSQFNNNEDHDAFRFFCQIQCCESL